MLKPMRVWRNWYECDCTAVGSEWICDALRGDSTDYCPCCDREAEPYSSEVLADVYQDSDEECDA